MVIKTGTCSDEKEKVDKSFTVKYQYKQAVIKDGTSVSDPIIILTQPSDVVDINYCYIPSLGRYYFINHIEALTGNRIALHCHVDVLMSFKTQFRKCYAILDKQEKTSNSTMYYDDNSYITESRSVLQAYQFPSGFTSVATIIITAGG